MAIESISIDKCLNRMRRAKAECEQSRSVEPIHKMFSDLETYVRCHNPDKTALANWARMHQLFDAHFDKWYRAFKSEVQNEQ